MVVGMVVVMIVCGIVGQKVVIDVGNFFLVEYLIFFGVLLFDLIKVEYYKEVFLKGMEEQKKEIDVIVNQCLVFDFDNIIVVFDQSGELLNKVSIVFSGLNSCNMNDEMQVFNKEIILLFLVYWDDISLNLVFFVCVKEVYECWEKLGLDKEQNKLLEEIYKKFVCGGVNFDFVDQVKLC